VAPAAMGSRGLACRYIAARLTRWEIGPFETERLRVYSMTKPRI
jgi:hypothetical protein